MASELYVGAERRGKRAYGYVFDDIETRLETVRLSSQCGFASTEEGNALTEEQQWARIALVKAIAEEAWK